MAVSVRGSDWKETAGKRIKITGLAGEFNLFLSFIRAMCYCGLTRGSSNGSGLLTSLGSCTMKSGSFFL